MPKLDIKMLGDLDIVYDGNSILHKMSSKAAGLLCYLALNEGKLISRDKLSQLFWDSNNMESARYNLRYTLWSIRKFLKNEFNDIDIIVNQKNCCKLNESIEVTSDVVQMKQICGQIMQNGKDIKSLEAVREIYKGELLENFEVKNCFELNDWIFYERENLQRKYFDVLNLLANEYRNQQKHLKCIEIYEEMLHINPLMEELYVELMKVYQDIGDRSAAMSQYERCREVLREELNIAPMESTSQVYAEIRNTYKRSPSPAGITSTTEQYQKSGVIVYTFDSTVFEAELSSDKYKRKLVTGCLPLDTLNCYWMWELFEAVFIQVDVLELKSIPEYYWRDISIIHSGAYKLMEDGKTFAALTSLNEKTRIFTSALAVMKMIARNTRYSIFIRDFQYMDETSREFLTFLIFNLDKLNIGLFLYISGECEKLDMLASYFDMRRV